MDERVTVRLTPDPIDPAEAARIASHADGAVVTFVGVVRKATGGRPVSGLAYEAYEGMAEQQMRAIAAEARSRFDVGAVLIVHRTGDLAVGEASVLVGVAAAHRGAAFDACEFCIDTLKTTVPIWKKELFADGTSAWVNHP